MPAAIKPKTLTIRAYQVGFGDCFLLSFRYPARGTKAAFDRHLLIDCGSTGKPDDVTGNLLGRVAEDIKTECAGKLHAVIATHRHRDHISGFATRDDGTGSGDIIRSLKPDLVLQPWTEDPEAEPDATSSTQALSLNGSFVRTLSDMHTFSESALAETRRLKGKIGARTFARLSFLGEDNLKNLSAVKNLMTMGKNRYLNYGMKSGLESILPGVKTHVLGPPTVKQYPEVKKERERDEEEFWHLQSLTGQRFLAKGKPAFPRAARYSTFPPHARWIIPRLRRIRGDQLLEIVRAMDNFLNNTSLILLFAAGTKKILFPGDAQIENWSYALKEAPDKETVRGLLAGVDFYKVGHHGSLNATPKTMWNLFARRKATSSPGRLRTVVSTRAGQHGELPDSEVPREKLLDALRAESDFFTTQNLTGGKLKEVFEISL